MLDMDRFWGRFGVPFGDLLAIKSPLERRISRLLLPLAPGCPRVSFLIDFEVICGSILEGF